MVAYLTWTLHNFNECQMRNAAKKTLNIEGREEEVPGTCWREEPPPMAVCRLASMDAHLGASWRPRTPIWPAVKRAGEA